MIAKIDVIRSEGANAAELLSSIDFNKCGTSQMVSFKYNGRNKRSLLYIPNIGCDSNKLNNFVNTKSFNKVTTQYKYIILPVLIALHGILFVHA